MSEDKQPENQHPYNNWRAVTESDFVTLFIKTWFAFVSTLRELYPQSRPYYEASGDSPFIQKYKKEFADKIFFLCPLTPDVEMSLHSTYKEGLRIISEKYPRFLVEDFYHINNSYSNKVEVEYHSVGGYSGKLVLKIQCISDEILKVVLSCSDKVFLEKVSEKPVLIDIKIDYQEILNRFIEKLEQTHQAVYERELIESFYGELFQIIKDELTDSLIQKRDSLPTKGFSKVKQVYDIMQSVCYQILESMKKSCLDSENSSKHKILAQMPIADFLQSYGELSSFDKQNAYLWFVGFVYRLRNALFHEIIDPLDSSWQFVFKNAYLVLKHIVDANITYLNTVALLLKIASLIYEKDFIDAPPPDIPIKSDDGTIFSYNGVELKYYNQTGAKVHIDSTITCQEKAYHVECNVKWDETLKQHKVKNVQISELDQPSKQQKEVTVS
ncbi:MAG: hypothetical protein IJL52_05350 [Clostridia bacterium]|nr:hypothetical protein [Clostridia bacterium]